MVVSVSLLERSVAVDINRETVEPVLWRQRQPGTAVSGLTVRHPAELPDWAGRAHPA
jgi:hypothetical protein